MRLLHPRANIYLDRARENPVAGDGEYGYLRSGDDRIFYNRWVPEGADRLVVCLHGMGAHGHYWASLADVLAPRGMAVYALDHHGHGLSDGAKGDMPDGNRLVEDARAFLRWAQERHPGCPLYLVGESMGGAIAILTAMEDRDLLRGCVLLAPALKAYTRMTWKQAVSLPYWGGLLAVRPQTNAVVIAGNEKFVHRNQKYVEFEAHDPDHLKVVSFRYLLNVKKLMDRARTEGPAGLRLPVLLMQGGSDKVCSAEAAKEFFTSLQAPDKTLKYYEQGYHCLLGDPTAPEVRDVIAGWIEER